MDLFALRGTPSTKPQGSMVELKMEDYDMDDLAGEIARALAACQDLAEDAPLTGNDGGDIASAR